MTSSVKSRSGWPKVIAARTRGRVARRRRTRFAACDVSCTRPLRRASLGRSRSAPPTAAVTEEADRVRRANEALVPRAACTVRRRPGADEEVRHVADGRLAGLERVVGGRGPAAAAGCRDAADVRPECRGRVVAHDAAEEDGLARGRDPGVDRAAERADEADVDAAARELGVEARDDVPLRARELELDPARRGDDPGPGDRDAHLQAAALVRRRPRRRRDRDRRDGEETSARLTERASGTRKRRGAPPASSSTTPPPPKRSVIWRFCVLCPMRVASFLYTSVSAALMRARKNCPPLGFAICCSVPGLGGRGSARRSRRRACS